MPELPDAPSVDSLDGDFQVRKVKIRGKRYVLKELSAREYEKVVKLAREDELAPDETLSRLILDKSLQEPKIPVDELYDGPFTVVQRLNEILRDIHYTPAEIEEENDEGEAQG